MGLFDKGSDDIADQAKDQEAKIRAFTRENIERSDKMLDAFDEMGQNPVQDTSADIDMDLLSGGTGQGEAASRRRRGRVQQGDMNPFGIDRDSVIAMSPIGQMKDSDGYPLEDKGNVFERK